MKKKICKNCRYYDKKVKFDNCGYETIMDASINFVGPNFGCIHCETFGEFFEKEKLKRTREVNLTKKEINLILRALSPYEVVGYCETLVKVRERDYDIAEKIVDKIKDLYPDD